MTALKNASIVLLVLLFFGFLFSCTIQDLNAPDKGPAAPVNDGLAPIPGNSGYLKTLQVLGTSLKLKWTKAMDSNSSQGSLQYQVYCSTDTNIESISNAQTNGMMVLDWTGDIDEALVTNLNAMTTYYFMVLVRDEWGNTTNYLLQNRTTVSLDGNYLPDPSFEAGGWNYNWYPYDSGVLYLQGGHIHTGSYGVYMYTGASSIASQCESWMDFTDNSRGKATKYLLPWNEGDAAVAYVWHKIWYNIPDLLVANYHIIVTFYSSNLTKLSVNEVRATTNCAFNTWETNDLYVVTGPAPAGTAYAEVTVGLWKAAGDIEQLLMTIDDAYLSVLTN